MNDKSYTNYAEMTDAAIIAQLGYYAKSKRLEQNKTQTYVSDAAGISRSTLSLLERGETVTISTLIQVLRVLDLLDFMDFFKIESRMSPIALAKLERAQRKRASSSGSSNEEKSDWR